MLFLVHIHYTYMFDNAFGVECSQKRGDIDPHGEHVARIWMHIHGERELDFLVVDQVHTCSVHGLGDRICIFVRHVQRKSDHLTRKCEPSELKLAVN